MSDFRRDEVQVKQLLRTTEHIVDQGPIDVQAAWTDSIEQRFVISDEVPMVDELLL